jgi:hypothetical protein
LNAFTPWRRVCRSTSVTGGYRVLALGGWVVAVPATRLSVRSPSGRGCAAEEPGECAERKSDDVSKRAADRTQYVGDRAEHLVLLCWIYLNSALPF